MNEDQNMTRRAWHALDTRIARARAKASPERQEAAQRLGWDMDILIMSIMYDAGLRQRATQAERARLIEHARQMRRELVLMVLLGEESGEPSADTLAEVQFRDKLTDDVEELDALQTGGLDHLRRDRRFARRTLTSPEASTQTPPARDTWN